MPQFNNIDELYEYAKTIIGYQLAIPKSTDFEQELAIFMSEAVRKYVYDKYKPKYYERRGLDSGLADPENSIITDVKLENGSIRVTFENLTEGHDNLHDEYIGDLIEFGEGYAGKHWQDPDGVWAEPRPFVAEMIDDIQSNPDYLINALKRDLKNMGFKIK